MPDFGINVASPLSGFNTLMQGVESRGEFERAKTQEVAKQGKLQELQRLYRDGSEGELTDFLIQNPGLGESLEESTAVEKRMTDSEDIDAAWNYYTTGDVNILTDRAQSVLDRGGSAEETLQLAQLAHTEPEKAKKIVAGMLARKDTDKFKAYRESQGLGGGEEKVGAQEILEDGTIIQSTPGGPVVFSPTGEKVKGKAAADAVATARAQKVSNLREAAGGKRSAALEADLKLKALVEATIINAKDAAKASGEAFTRVEKIYENIQNMNEGIRLVEEENADTGVIASRMPSMRASAIKLDNLQARLGLDVIGNTTFGALSESELKFALSAALPKGLEGPALVDWMKQKVSTQERLADYLESAAIYLGTPGNTKKGWVEYQRNKVGDKYGTQQIPTINDEAEYSKLPSGATFIDSADGKQYRKP